MRVLEQVLTPGVQYGKEANLCPQVLGIGRDRAQGLVRGLKEDAVDLLFVLVGDRSNWLRDSEDDVEIADVEKLGSTVVKPLGASQALALRTMPISARVVTDALIVTVIALLDVTAKRCGSTCLDRTHDATLGVRERRAMVLAIGFTEVAEDIRHF